jgi:MFS family permease
MEINKSKLFTASCVALITTSMAFGLRAGMLSTWGTEFNLTVEELGWISGTAFWGFTLAMIFGGPLCDVLGMKNILYIAFLGQVSGIALTIFAGGFWSLFISTMLIGIGNGMVEAACNPLVATIYSDEKTKMLNRFHVWFPGGIVIGGLTGYFLGGMGISWQLQLVTMFIPAFIYGFLIMKETFPVTERVSSGVSTGDMFKACLSPLFIIMLIIMTITASTELGTNQLIDSLLRDTGVSPILILVYISGLMMIGRTYAGNFVHSFSPAGMLLFSAIFSTAGLLLLSMSTGLFFTFGAATVFAVGVCFFWPTMIGFVAEYLPRTGALGLSLMGGTGMLFVALVLPVLGKQLDNQSGAETLKGFSIFPAVLIVAFSILLVYSKKLKPSH